MQYKIEKHKIEIDHQEPSFCQFITTFTLMPRTIRVLCVLTQECCIVQEQVLLTCQSIGELILYLKLKKPITVLYSVYYFLNQPISNRVVDKAVIMEHN